MLTQSQRFIVRELARRVRSDTYWRRASSLRMLVRFERMIIANPDEVVQIAGAVREEFNTRRRP